MDKKRIILNKKDLELGSQDKKKVSLLKELVSRFFNNIDQYKSNNYDEAKTRVDFIDKFFELLGWDLSNRQGFSEAYRDVIREDKIRIEGNQKAPDYCFKIGVERKFFVEAKKPSVNIKDDIGAAYQLRRYAYSTKLPMSILTDFHEFAVYDTRIKPKPKDKAEVARIFYCKLDEYEQNFDFIYNTFSKNAILKGSFDRYVADKTKKKGTSEVDKEFLKLIETWRNDLAKNIAVNNKKLDLFSLNTSVQKIIDRLIFLRIAEARNIEEYDNLSKIADSSNVYKKLDEYFQQADKRYNSGLFKVENWLSDLKIDDKILKDLIKSTYYPESPYEFSVLPVEILGNIYEQFLGKVIHLTPSHQAKIEEKPEVKKAGGVYYTPQYIVDYIVKNTVGEKLKGLTPEKVEALKILDPACGSGSFLLGAYAYLLRWHLDYYTKDKKSLEKFKKAGKIYDYKGDFKLTIDEKKKILKNNIFGVDIDSQAVEVTKLSLLLKLMEDETQQSAGMLIKYSKEALLPDLQDNIKCGNSLIGPDFYEGKNMSLFGNDEMRKVNAFDWQKEFNDIFANGGFDVVIGNPPYVLIEGDFRDENLIKYFTNNYFSPASKIDLYHIFLEKGIILLNPNGLLGVITPSNYLTNNGLKKLREFILKSTRIKILNVIAGKVFQNASVDTTITVLSKNLKDVSSYILSNWGENRLDQIKVEIFNQKNFYENINYLFTASKHDKLRVATYLLGDKFYVKFGMQLRDRKQYLGDVINSNQKSLITTWHKQCYTGKDIGRYFLNYSDLLCYTNKIAQRGGCWDFRFHNRNPKILIRQIGQNPICALDQRGYYCLNTLFMIVPKEEYVDYNLSFILGILNSKFIKYYWQTNFYDLRKTFPKIKGTYLEQLPIPEATSVKQKVIITLVDQMLEVQKKFHSAKTEADKKLYQQKIDILDGQIDAEVYKLYGLSEEEIKIVEGK